MVDIEETGHATITFTKSATTATWTETENLTILELAEKAGLKPQYGCRSAMCGSCEVKITYAVVPLSTLTKLDLRVEIDTDLNLV